MKVFITFLLTSAFWIFVIWLAGSDIAKDDNADYTEEIVGKWVPDEGAQYPLEFTRYGTIIVYKGYVAPRYEYILAGSRLAIDTGHKMQMKIYSDDNFSYMELTGDAEYSGRYRTKRTNR